MFCYIKNRYSSICLPDIHMTNIIVQYTPHRVWGHVLLWEQSEPLKNTQSYGAEQEMECSALYALSFLFFFFVSVILYLHHSLLISPHTSFHFPFLCSCLFVSKSTELNLIKLNTYMMWLHYITPETILKSSSI